MKAPRLDLVIATLALLVSAGATISSLYQTRVIANQLSSSVWPYLSINTTLSDGGRYQLAVDNDGLGPALVRSAALFIDGTRVSSYRSGLARLTHEQDAAQRFFQGSYSDIGPTTVVRAGETAQLVSIVPRRRFALGDLNRRVILRVCYCSLLDQCWNVEGKTQRVPVAACDSAQDLAY